MANASFEKVLSECNHFEGMVSDFDIGLFQAFLEYQASKQLQGDLLEFGVYKGKSATVLLRNLKKNERLYLVDVAADYPAAFLHKYKDEKINFYNCASEVFRSKVENFSKMKKSFRFIHSDGSHYFSNVCNDLQLADELLAKNGVMVLDDFCNTNYPQVAAATYKYLFKWRSGFKMFLVGKNKAFLCRKEYFAFYTEFVKTVLPGKMREYGQPARLAKTDRNEAFDVVSAEPRQPDESEIYGQSLYGHYLS